MGQDIFEGGSDQACKNGKGVRSIVDDVHIFGTKKKYMTESA